MPMTVGRPTPGQSFLDQWVTEHGESERRRVYGDPEPPELDAVAAEEPEPYDREAFSPRRWAARNAAISDAMGERFEAEPAYNAPGDEQSPYMPMDATPAPVGPPDPAPESRDSSRAYVVREGNWRERIGLPRKRKSVPPSRTPEARRLRHLQSLVDAGKFPDLTAAKYGAPQRTSFGKPRRIRSKP
jgi:hypothetical protein